MSEFAVLLTDYAWDDVEIEQSILAEVDARLIVADRLDETRLVELADGVDAILTCWATTTSRVLAAAPNCQIVSRLGIGLDNVDVAYCTEHGIPVTNVPGYCSIEVAEHTIALLLALSRKIAFFHYEMKNGRYDLAAAGPISRLEGQTLGIVGLGGIGKQVAKKASALGLRVIATTRSPRPSSEFDVEFVDLDELLSKSDYVSLHLPLTADTRQLIGQRELSLMKPTSHLINTSRGALVDERALTSALESDQIAGAALDVHDPEPPDLSTMPHCDPRVIATPHAAFASVEAIDELRRRATRNVALRLSGQVPNDIVNPEWRASR